MTRNGTIPPSLSPPETPAAWPAVPGRDPLAVVVVPTFRRPAMLAETLASLAGQRAQVPFAVLVVENDAAGREGEAVARALFEAGRLKGLSIVEPSPGNVRAINAGFAAALERYPAAAFLLMMDDDEVAAPDWLERMVSAASRTGADIVGGPVLPRFSAAVPESMRLHPVFWPAYRESGPVPMIYGSGNCLVRRRVFERLGQPAFDLRFDRLGGGDTDFFRRASLAGFSAYWAGEAVITETVPAMRTQPGWVLRRGLRIGAINRAIDAKARPGAGGRLVVAVKDAAILAVSPWRVARELVRTRQWFIALHPLVVALGRIASAFGVEPHQYGRRRPT